MSLHTTSATRTQSQVWLEHARALIAYAKDHPAFAAYYLKVTAPLGEQLTDTLPLPSLEPYSHWLIPDTEAIAKKRLDWLRQEAEQQQAEKLIALLVAGRRSLPQDIVIGVVGVAIIGPTLGLIDSKKKRFQRLRVIIPQSQSTKLSPAELASVVTTASHRLVAMELRLCGGNAYRLAPDTAEWLFTEQVPELATVKDEDSLKQATEFLSSENLSHCVYETEEPIVSVVAISPTVAETILDQLGATPVKTD